jgi:hypothetical protein
MIFMFIRMEKFILISLILVGLLCPNGGLAAGQMFWDWPAGSPFKDVELLGAAVDEHGALVPGLTARATGPIGSEVCWSVAPDGKGGFFTGTGHGGEIHHTDKNGETRVFAELEGAEVFSLWPLPDGGLFAGCGSEGDFYRVDSTGDHQLLGKVPGGYIWAIVADESGKTVWLATGSPAAIYRYTADTGLEELISFPAQNTLDLMLDRDGSLLAATQGPGLVYRLDPENPVTPWLICETRQDEVRQFLRGPDDHIFFLALNNSPNNADDEGSKSPNNGAIPPSLMSLFGVMETPQVDKAALFRVEEDDRFSPWWSGNLDLMIVAWSPEWGWLGGGPLASGDGLAMVHRLIPPASDYVLAAWPGGDILDIVLMDPKNSKMSLLVSQAHPGGVQRLMAVTDEPLFAISPPLDAGSPVTWGHLNWQGEAGPGKLRWSVRCGNRSTPDNSWTQWSDSWTTDDRDLELPATRFLQWRVEMPPRKQGAEKTWRVNSVSVSAWQENSPPVVRSFTIENLSEINRGGLSGMSDNVTQSFASGLKVEFGRKSLANARVGARRAAFTRPVRVMTWDGRDANSDRLLYRLEFRRQDEQSWRTIIEETAEQLGSWDTSEVPDGRYQVRVVVSDRLDNPGDQALSNSREAGPLLVDNTPAELSSFQVKKVEGGMRLSFKVQDQASVLAQAVVRLPDGREERLDPKDLICDSRSEEFDVVIPWPVSGRPEGDDPWRLRVEVWDLAGNSTIAEGEAR